VARVAVVGAGYVGLSAAACLAELGNDVVSTDNNDALIMSPIFQNLYHVA
jgi:UDP-glucose 6-dehydrogenase